MVPAAVAFIAALSEIRENAYKFALNLGEIKSDNRSKKSANDHKQALEFSRGYSISAKPTFIQAIRKENAMFDVV